MEEIEQLVTKLTGFLTQSYFHFTKFIFLFITAFPLIFDDWVNMEPFANTCKLTDSLGVIKIFCII